MFLINEDKSIYITRGDVAIIDITAEEADGTSHTFQKGDVVRIQVFEKKRHENVVLRKDVVAAAETGCMTIQLSAEDTTIGEIINKPVDYWYEVELNPDTAPQTIIGYDEDGAKVFRLFPEGSDIDE